MAELELPDPGHPRLTGKARAHGTPRVPELRPGGETVLGTVPGRDGVASLPSAREPG